ncbi:MAG: intradiol ring-cleavage dioxygenase [Ilumatobacteraceae bacterium]
MNEELHDHDRGLAFDLSTSIARRRLFTLFAGAGLAAVIAGCSSDSKSPATSSTASPSATSPSAATVSATATNDVVVATSPAATTAAAASSSALQAIPEETAGPYPGDGSNGLDVLKESGIVRSDIRASFGSSSTVAKGVPTTIKLTMVDANGGAPLPGAAVYIWHCDAGGLYSMYSQGATKENYLRGVQAADANGVVTFTSIYPACYAGRWPHIHFEVYPTMADATSASNRLATSQLALTKEVSAAVYASDGYPNSTQNLSQVSLATDMVFSDGADLETPTITGSVAAGYTIAMSAAITT